MLSRRSLFQSAAGLIGAAVVAKPDQQVSAPPVHLPTVIGYDPGRPGGDATAILFGTVTTSAAYVDYVHTTWSADVSPMVIRHPDGGRSVMVRRR